MKRRTVVVIHSYLEGRQGLCAQGAYPRHHLWGIDALAARGWEVRLVESRKAGPIAHQWGRLTRGRFGHLDQEWRAVRLLRDADVLYAVTGDLFWLPLCRRSGAIRAKVAAWHYVPPAVGPIWKLRGWQHREFFSRGLDGVLCLTNRATEHFRTRLPRALVERVDWGVDAEMFRPPASGVGGGFFVSCGKTERDLGALVAGVAGTAHRVQLIVPETHLAGVSLPPNMVRAGGPATGSDDRGPSYAELIERFYAPAIAFLIPLVAHPNNGAGYTNMLEAFAMGKPVVMTRTGCIDIDIEREGVGLYVDPGDPRGWARALDRLVRKPEEASAMGVRARALAEQHFNYRRFGERVCAFLDRLCPMEE